MLCQNLHKIPEAHTPTLFAQSEAIRLQELEDVANMPLVDNILKMFPDSELVQVHQKLKDKKQEDKE